jgi:quercetin 2,3-dioxygenase
MSAPKKAESILGRLLTLLERDGDGVIVQAEEDAELLVVRGQPLDGTVLAYRPIVMNTSQELQTVAANVWAGRFGQLG